MKKSIKVASNFMFRLHAIVLDTIYSNNFNEEMFMYPIMDGIYISSSKQENIEKCIVNIFSELLNLFIEVDTKYRSKANINYNFLVKASISYGEINEGRYISTDVLPYFKNHDNYVRRLMIGKPIINAYENEKKASPFGIYVDSNAKKFFDRNMFSKKEPSDFLWWESIFCDFDLDILQNLYSCILNYYEFYLDLYLKNKSSYSSVKIKEHLIRVNSYFLSDNKDIDCTNRTADIISTI